MNIRLAGCLIVDSENKIMLLHRNKKCVTQWELPGGKIESGESAEQAAVRELREELGIEVRIDNELGNTSFEEAGKKFEYIWFGATVLSGEPHVCEPNTIDELASFRISELSTLKLSGNMMNLHARLVDGGVVLPARVSRKL